MDSLHGRPAGTVPFPLLKRDGCYCFYGQALLEANILIDELSHLLTSTDRMAFTIAARTLLELGKELISSDDVAIYELIKNAFDAGSTKIEITAQVIIAARTFRAAIEALDGASPTPRAILRSLSNAILPGVPAAVTQDFLGSLEDAVQDVAAFRAALQRGYAAHGWIKVSDSGHGMSLDDLETIYLRIGTRSRREQNVKGATFLGDKGVGRLSAMRLGERLSVVTTKTGEPTWHQLDIDWTIFSHENDTDLGLIVIDPIEAAKKSDRAVQGTTITVSDLSGDWGFARFEEMMSGRIARLIDPFSPGRANQLLTVRFNNERVLVPSIPKTLLASAHAACHVKFYFDKAGEPVLEGLIDYPLKAAQRPVFQKGAEIFSIAQRTVKKRGKKGHAAVETVPLRPKDLQDLGPFSCDIYWYNRRVVEAIAELTENRRATQDAIAAWSGGPMLYRHEFRVLPYGDPDDDWLELDRNAFGESGFKLNRQQVIGRVGVNSAHTALSEQTNREGLVQSEAADALRTILMWLLHVEMRNFINEADARELLSKRTAETDALEFRETQDAVESALRALKARIAKEDQPYLDQLEKNVTALAGQCAALLSRLTESVAESREDREKFVHLAGIGLITEFIFHELDAPSLIP